MMTGAVSVVCEVVLFLSCVVCVRHVYKCHSIQKSLDFPLGWILGISLIGLGSLLGALRYSGAHIQILGSDIVVYHVMVSHIAGFFGAMNIALSSYLSIATPFQWFQSGKLNRQIREYMPYVLCVVFAILQYYEYYGLGGVTLLNVQMPVMHCRITVGDLVKLGPTVFMVLLLVWASVLILAGKVSGVRRSKCSYLIAAILVFYVADQLKNSGISFSLFNNSTILKVNCGYGCNALVLSSVDLFHLVLSVAVFCFANVSWPSLSLWA